MCWSPGCGNHAAMLKTLSLWIHTRTHGGAVTFLQQPLERHSSTSFYQEEKGIWKSTALPPDPHGVLQPLIQRNKKGGRSQHWRWMGRSDEFEFHPLEAQEDLIILLGPQAKRKVTRSQSTSKGACCLGATTATAARVDS